MKMIKMIKILLIEIYFMTKKKSGRLGLTRMNRSSDACVAGKSVANDKTLALL